MNSLLSPAVKQFISYFFVGGAAALVEWISFFFLSAILKMNYIVATCFAFVLSTTANWLLGRMWTFRGSKRYRNHKGREALLVFAVSAVGLIFNVVLMYAFVTLLGMNTDALKTVSKIAATGIVFIWNYLSRKYLIYREDT